MLLIVDQPTTFGALSATVTLAMGIEVTYLSKLALHRIADLHQGIANTDVRSTYVTARPAALAICAVLDQS